MKKFFMFGLVLSLLLSSALLAQSDVQAISVNFRHVGDESGGGWGYHNSIFLPLHDVDSYEPVSGYIPVSGWNEPYQMVNGDVLELTDNSGNATSAAMSVDRSFSYGWALNVDNGYGSITDLERNIGRIFNGFIGHNGGGAKRKIVEVENVPYSNYNVYVMLVIDASDRDSEISIGDQTFYYRSVSNHTSDLFSRSEGPWVIADVTTAPGTYTPATLAVFENVTDPTLLIEFKCASNSGISGFQIVSNTPSGMAANNPSPENNSIVPVTAGLSWEAPTEITPTGYDLYFGDKNDPNWNLAPVLQNTTDTSYTPSEELEYNTEYVWRVDVHDPNNGEPILWGGNYWYFNTEGDPIILTQPWSLAAPLGGSTFFSVETALTESYSWYSSADAASDTPADDVLLQSGESNILEITGAQAEDFTYYYCTLHNSIPGSVAIATDVVELKEGKLEAYLPFDGDPNDSVADWNAENGNEGVTNTYEDGIQGQSIRFVRDSGDQLIIPGSEEYFNFFTEGFTSTFWVKPNDYTGLQGYMTYVAKRSGSTGWNMYDTAFYASLSFEANMYPIGAVTDNRERLDDGQWHMVAMSYDPAAQAVQLFVDGVASGGPKYGVPAINNNAVTIGSYDMTGTGGWGYSGLIDELKIYSYPLTPFEIAQEYSSVSGNGFCVQQLPGDLNEDCRIDTADLAMMLPEWAEDGSGTQGGNVVSWQFDENSGTTVADASGNGNVGILGSGFTSGYWQPGAGVTGDPADGALYMDGSSDMSVICNVSDPNNFSNGAGNVFFGTSDWTINCWFKFETVPGMVSLAGFGDCEWVEGAVGNPDRHFASWDNGLEFELSGDGFWPGSELYGEGQWRMLTATYDAEKMIGKVFIDGELVATKTDLVLTNTDEGAFKINSEGWIAWATYEDQVPLQGWVDDYTVWDQAMSEYWVKARFNGEHTVSLEYDITSDGKVDLLDFSVLASSWMHCNWVPQDECN